MEKNCPRCGKPSEDVKFRTFGRSFSQDPELPAEILVRSKTPVCETCYRTCKERFESKYKEKLAIP